MDQVFLEEKERQLAERFATLTARIKKLKKVMSELTEQKEKAAYALRDYLEERCKESTAKYSDLGEFTYHETMYFSNKKGVMAEVSEWLKRIGRTDVLAEYQTAEVSDADLRSVIKEQMENGGELCPGLQTYNKLVITNRR